MMQRIAVQPIAIDQDVVAARRRSRQIAGFLGLEAQEQTRVATAVSEIVRNAFRYGGGGEVEFSLDAEGPAQSLVVTVTDRGPGIADLDAVLSGRYRSSTGMGLGIAGAHRLVDRCEIQTERGRGTRVTLHKRLPTDAAERAALDLASLRAQLAVGEQPGPHDELLQQHRELLRALADLNDRQQQMERINRELDDTNRGVVALYAELEEKAEHLRRADETKSRFLSNMSHEFRTPLNSVRALTGLLLDQVDGPLNDEQRKQVELVRKAAGDLAQLVEDLLDLAKIEAGRIDVQPSEFSIEGLFSGLRGMLRPLLVSESLALRFDAAPGLPLLHTDEAKVSQILHNFISNALKFTERGEVAVTATLAADGQAVAIAVSDTGIGIAREHQELIFEEFGQVKGPLQRRVRGTGLGLPLCRRLAGLLGGTIALESEPGVGSTFTVTLPIRLDEAPPAERAAPAKAPEPLAFDVARVPVLVVAAQAGHRIYYERLLRGTPYQHVGARDAAEARDRFRNASFGAILVDGLLSDEELGRWLRELRELEFGSRRVGVIAVTDGSDPEPPADAGVDVVLGRPLAPEAIIAALDRLTGWRILIVDDDDATRYALRRLLDIASFRVLEAADGRSGWNAARGARPDLIILDLGLPDFGGDELLARLREDPAMRDIPVIVATAQDFSTIDVPTLRRHAQAVVSKRELEENAVEMIARALKRRVPADLS